MSRTEQPDTRATETAPGRVFELLVDDDCTHAWLNIRVTDATKQLDSAAVVRFLSNQGIAVRDEILNRLADPGPIERLLVAEGSAPTAPSDAEVHWIVTPAEQKRSVAEGRIDFHQVTEFVAVRADQAICEFTDSVPGQPGIDVFGKEIRALQARRAPLRLGSGVRLAADGRTVESRVDGCLRVADGAVSVEQTFTVKADVDYSVGNIDFNGQVIVNGNVLDGFSVRASKDVIVRGAVNGASIEAGGHIRITGGVAGHGKGTLRAQGEISARYLDSVGVEAGANVHVHTEILNSPVASGGTVEVDQGRIIGGRIVAAGRVKVAILGSAMCVPTLVEAGVDIVSEKRLEKLSGDYAALAAQIARIEQAVGPLVQDPARVDSLPPAKADALRKLLSQLADRKAAAEALQTEIDALKAGPQNQTVRGAVIVTRRIFPNVEVKIGRENSHRYADELVGPVQLVADPDKGTLKAS